MFFIGLMEDNIIFLVYYWMNFVRIFYDIDVFEFWRIILEDVIWIYKLRELGLEVNVKYVGWEI